LRALGQLASTHVVNKLRCLRAPGESFSDAILRLGGGGALTRDEHLAWCKRRALECVDAGDLSRAVAGMASDLRTHPDTDNPALNGLVALHSDYDSLTGVG
jgi:hypothetical protein